MHTERKKGSDIERSTMNSSLHSDSSNNTDHIRFSDTKQTQEQAIYSHGSRKKKGYDSCQLTSYKLGDLLKKHLTILSDRCSYRPDLVLELWPKIVGAQVASMTRAIKFENKILYVCVKNSTLLSILSRASDKTRLIHKMMEAMPGVEILDLFFRFG